MAMESPYQWLVTGAAGFIGSNVCRHLLCQGHRVVGFDNFASGRRENVDRLTSVGDRQFDFVEGDIRDGNTLGRAITDCDFVVHLAALVSVQQSIGDPDLTQEINVGGFNRVYQAALSAGVERFVYASSSAVYGDADMAQMPLQETTSPAPVS
ncbi:MAG TPA: NAD-dependent epimerase/dehydratase family protein, partial [Rhodospirillales bacterium]|nr:NAD-dependent epimerase/dehydratase family protein [Rhodospirillales bacterium]